MRIGLIAGNGRFPFLALSAARRMGHDVTVVAIKEEALPEIADAARLLWGIGAAIGAAFVDQEAAATKLVFHAPDRALQHPGDLAGLQVAEILRRSGQGADT